MMNKQQYESNKAVLAGAPEGSTLTCTICEDNQRLYIDNLDMLANGLATLWTVCGEEFDSESRYTSFNDDLQSLSDIETLCSQYERIEALEEELWRTYQDSEKTVSRAAEIIEKRDKRIAELEKELSHVITEGDKQQAITNLRQQAKGVEDGVRLPMMSYIHINSIGLLKYAKQLNKQADELEQNK